MFIVLKIKKYARLFLFAILILVFIWAVHILTNLKIAVYKHDRLLPIYCVDRKDKKIAITFDAAWGNDDTNDLLEILEKYNIKATFFLVGFWVDKYPKDVMKIHEKGHEIGSHSDKHYHMSTLNEENIIDDIKRCENKIYNLIGKKPVVFRPPYGDYNNRLIKVLNELGYYVIQWDVDSLDWKDLKPEQIERRVISKVKSGSIILFHNNAKWTKYALPNIIENLKSIGYSFVTISELIYKDNFYIDPAGVQKKLDE